MKKQMAVTLYPIQQSPELVPDEIPVGAIVEVVREVEHKDFYSGKGYLILWEEKCYADVVDISRLEFIDVDQQDMKEMERTQ